MSKPRQAYKPHPSSTRSSPLSDQNLYKTALKPQIDVDIETMMEQDEMDFDTLWNEDEWGSVEDWNKRELSTRLPDDTEEDVARRSGLLMWYEKHKARNHSVMLGSRLMPLHVADKGMDGEVSEEELCHEWDNDMELISNIEWLNLGRKGQLALVHGVYGNQAEMATKYSWLVITLEIPSFEDRKV